MGANFKNVRAVGRFVILKFISVERELYRKKGDLFVPGDGDKETYKALIHDIGPEVENPTFEVGDEVMFNQYDMKGVEDNNDNRYGIVQGTNIMAVLETE